MITASDAARIAEDVAKITRSYIDKNVSITVVMPKDASQINPIYTIRTGYIDMNTYPITTVSIME